MNYTGFIYIWYDRKKKWFTIGSHYGTTDDGYITSTGIMSKAFKKRPQDFKRKILEYHHGDRKELLAFEQKWLDKISDNELFNKTNLKEKTTRYYNIKKQASGLSGELASRLRKEYWESDKGKDHKIRLSKMMSEKNPSKPGKEAWNKGKKCPQISEAIKNSDWTPNNDQRAKMRNNTKARWERGDFDNRPKQSKETVQKRIQTNKDRGFKQTDYQKKVVAEANKSSYKIIWVNGVEEIFTGLKDFLIDERGIPEATLHCILKDKRGSKKWGIKSLRRLN